MQKGIFGILTVIFLLVTIVSVNFKTEVTSDTKIKYSNEDTCGPIGNDKKIEYIFTSDRDITGIKLYIATYGKKIRKGRLKLEVFDAGTNERLAQVSREAKYLENNKFVLFETGKLETKDRELRIEITASQFKDRAPVGIWIGSNDLDNYSKTYNTMGESISKQLILTTTYATSKNLFTWELLLITLICFVCFTCTMVEKDKQSDEKVEEVFDDESQN